MFFPDYWWLDLAFELLFIYLFIKEVSDETPESMKNIFRFMIVGGSATILFLSGKELLLTFNRDFFLILTFLFSLLFVTLYSLKLIRSFQMNKTIQ
ncbi:MAG: hypothetical protein IJ875_05320 [Solobacterium sp.]|nr:hypothetical protein [Solobacterium sp.]